MENTTDAVAGNAQFALAPWLGRAAGPACAGVAGSLPSSATALEIVGSNTYIS